MSGFFLPVQKAVYDRLVAQVNSATTYDDVPQLPDGQPSADFPYIVIGDDYGESWDTDDTLGNEVEITLHVWSRYPGKKEAKEIMQDIYTALNRQQANLSAAGYRFVDCLHSFSDIFDEDDGKTRHGLCRYIILVEEA